MLSIALGSGTVTDAQGNLFVRPGAVVDSFGRGTPLPPSHPGLHGRSPGTECSRVFILFMPRTATALANETKNLTNLLGLY